MIKCDKREIKRIRWVCYIFSMKFLNSIFSKISDGGRAREEAYFCPFHRNMPEKKQNSIKFKKEKEKQNLLWKIQVTKNIKYDRKNILC